VRPAAELKRYAWDGKMKIYGYSKTKVNSDGLLEMGEVTIQTNPDSLRKIAQFLLKCADIIEEHGDSFGHEHFKDQFDKRNNEITDIIVVRK
jgi:hypothetical protein